MDMTGDDELMVMPSALQKSEPISSARMVVCRLEDLALKDRRPRLPIQHARRGDALTGMSIWRLSICLW
jgi:hypothetical protein